MFSQSSRYSNIADAEVTLPDGRRVIYKRRRLLPDPETLQTLSTVLVGTDDRLDLIAARTLGHPELYWMIADANGAMDPASLTDQSGLTLRIPIPEPR